MILSSEEIILRPLEKNDASLIAPLANNRNVWNNIRNIMPHPYTVKDAHDFIHHVQNKSSDYIFAIVFHNELCGAIGLHKQKDVYSRNLELGYWIGEPYWNKGIGTESVKLISNHFLGLEEYRRIYAAVFEYNLASRKVLEKNAFTFEGISRKAVLKNGKFWDEYRYGLLAEDLNTKAHTLRNTPKE